MPRHAYMVSMRFCDDPQCGLHLISLDENETPICESILSAAQTLELIERCKEHLYAKATEQGEDRTPG